LEGLKKLLGESRKATGLETVCFKPRRERERERDKERDRDGK
jgi:hypothetical protein